VFDSKEHFNEMMAKVFSPPDGPGPLAAHAARATRLVEDAEGRFHTVLYVFREGAEFDPVADLAEAQ
jgi:hypothetical protein